MNKVQVTEKPVRSRSYLRFRARLLIGLALMAVLAVAVVVIQIQSADQERKVAIRKQTEHYVQAMEAHVVYSIQFIDLSLTGFANAIEVLSPQQAASASTITALLSSRGATFTHDYWITFIDAHGIAVAASNNLQVAGISYADRDYFKVHLGKDRISGLYVGEPMVGQAGKQRLFALSRRVENAKGEFLGVIVAPLDANRFAKVFDDSRFSPDVSIALVHGKGKIIARAPNFEEAFGRNLDATPLFDNVRKSKFGTYQATSSIDGLPRVFSYRVLDEFPLIVVVGSSARESNRIVERNTWIAGAGLGLLLTLMLAGGHFSLRTYTRLEERELRYRQLYVSSRETKAKLSESEQLGALMYRNSSEGMMVTDAEGRILSVNNAFTRLSGYAEQEVVGHHAYELTSGRQDENFFHRMEQSISASGQWEGELWHQHKNGEHYLVSLRFNTVYDKDGKAFRHVGLFSDITKKKASEELIWRQANFDTLTGLPNRRMFHEHLRLEMKKTDRSLLPMALVFVDLDYFKEVNDTLGHDKGDLLLKEVAIRLTASVRGSDVVARLGGDEFTVILSELHNSGDVVRIAQEILKQMSTPFHLEQEVAHISASIGITLYPDDGASADVLMQNADQAMYAAKQQGRNRFSYFAPFMEEATRTRLELSNELRDAVSHDQLRILFQPIVELASGRICKAEALVRWEHPRRGLLNPADFIGIAENTGMIVGIGDWVFRRAADAARRLRDAGAADFPICVNKSAWQFRDDGNNFQQWLAYLASLELDPHNIIIEVTENLLLDQASAVSEHLKALQRAHMQLSLDDFGSGYASLAFLKRYDIDYIKIDPLFVSNLAEGTDGIALCEAIIAMAHKMDIRVIAEGIETPQQLQVLKAANCDFGQGFLFSRPISEAELEKQLKNGV